jgi:hypothetical protein
MIMATDGRQLGFLGRHFNRRNLLAGGATAVASAALAAATPLEAAFNAGERACCPVRNLEAAAYRKVTVAEAAQGNQQAAALASKSSLVSKAKDNLYQLANSIPDAQMRAATLAILDLPSPTYQLLSPSASDKQAVYQELLDAGLIPDATTVDGVFPPIDDANHAAQPVWAAPGSTYQGHHSYPGGLVVHEWVNGTLAKAFNDIYEAAYGLVSGPTAIDLSISQAAPLWHDIHKTVVMQWMPDGSELVEQTIADTGAHHPISGAEAITRGMPADFVVAMLSAHDAPTTSKDTVTSITPILTGYQRLVNYIRAAAIIARVDPISYGLLVQNSDGIYALKQDPPRFEGFINHLSDHDFLITGDSATRLIKTLQGIAGDWGIDATGDPNRFNLFRNTVFSQVADMRLYGALIAGGVDGVRSMINQEVDLSPLG